MVLYVKARSLPPQPDMPPGTGQLQTMQSIDQALGNVEQQDIMDRVAEDWITGNRGGPGQQHLPSLS